MSGNVFVVNKPSAPGEHIPVVVQGTAFTTDTQGGTRTYDWAGNSRTAVATASTAAAALPTLSASRELMAHASTRCFVRFGASDVGAASAAAGHLVLEAGERFHFRVATGNTHFRVIRDTADGFLTLTAVV